ncbi:MAG: vWA domain-containing protein [Bryobacteraceae bacterium]
MFFLNLTPAEILALFGSASAVVVALYLFDRARRRVQVSTLRFWVEAKHPVTAHRKVRVQDPWSLILQLAGIGLLLLAIGQLQLGSRAGVPFDHVVILDTSSWMAARVPGSKTILMEQGQARARSYLRAIPRADRVMLIRGDALATPVTSFEQDRAKIETAIAQSKPGATAFNLEQAVAFARQAQAVGGRRSGEIVVISSGRTFSSGGPAVPLPPLPNLRYIPLAADIENCGLRRISLRRSDSSPDLWDIFVSVKNYGQKPRSIPLALLFGGAPAGSRQMTLAPGAEQEATFTLRTSAAGILDARLISRDGFSGDDRATLELPEQRKLRVIAYTTDPTSLKPLLEANPKLSPQIRAPALYDAKADTDVMILDRFRPAVLPERDSLWIDPPPNGPFAVKQRATKVRLAQWNTDHVLAAGLRSKDFTLDSVSVFAPGPKDIAVARIDAGPVIVAREGKPKIAAIGFHPAASSLRYELSTPLVFANVFRWIAPNVFRRGEVSLGSAGMVRVALERSIDPETVKVHRQDGGAIPFTVNEGYLSYFSGTRGTVQVAAGDRDFSYSLTLPEVGEGRWQPPANIRRGVPPPAPLLAAASDVWPWLAVAGGLLLLVEWLIYGRSSAGIRARLPQVAPWLVFPRFRRSES